MQGVVHDHFPLKGENDNQCEQQADNRDIVKLGNKLLLEVFRAFMLYQPYPCGDTGGQWYHNEQNDRQD